MSIYFLCPDSNNPSGGIRKLYRHVDILNGAGFPAFILHQRSGFRCTWFTNDTRIAYIPAVIANRDQLASDYLVIPEVYDPNIVNITKGLKKIIFNQGCYNTFSGYSLNEFDLRTPYHHKEVLATLVVSEDSRRYLQYVFPELKIVRVHNGIDQSIFSYEPEKKKRQLAFMLHKTPEDVVQVINILKFRGALKDFHLAPIENRSETEVAAILKESAIFLSFATREGFSLPAAEAMACGCIVVGYHGMGGREYFKPEFSYPVPIGDVITFARTVEEVIETYGASPEQLMERAERAASYIRDNYPLEREEQEIVGFWSSITSMKATEIR